MTAPVRAGRDLYIDPACVVSMVWDHRFYVNGSDSVLVIRMDDGVEHRLRHAPHLGLDAYELKKALTTSASEDQP